MRRNYEVSMGKEATVTMSLSDYEKLKEHSRLYSEMKMREYNIKANLSGIKE